TAPTTTASGSRLSAASLTGQLARLRPRPSAALATGLTLLGALIVFALVAPVFGSPTRIYANGISAKGLPLGIGASGHILGTDGIGRDMLARLAAGGRTTLEFTFIANVTSIGLGVIVGVIAGFLRGVVEHVLMRITEIFLSVPTVISGLALASVIGEGVLGIVVVITALYWAWTSRVVFGEVLALRKRPFVEAAVAQGVPSFTIMRRHILPHLLSLLLVIWALNGAAVVAIGAGLSYLGAGIQPPTAEWGEMLSAGQNALEYMPHEVLEPLVCIVLTVLAFVLIADGITRRGSVARRRSWLDI
ncbi:MAG: ABC transporter permease, partial [Solirubrobacteraceae bacterium]